MGRILKVLLFSFLRLLKPCDDCAPPYGYRNNMPLSIKTEEFAKEVRKAPISGNLDAPEGGFDAIMQAIVCKVGHKAYFLKKKALFLIF